jgi:hypothetical protein
MESAEVSYRRLTKKRREQNKKVEEPVGGGLGRQAKRVGWITKLVSKCNEGNQDRGQTATSLKIRV